MTTQDQKQALASVLTQYVNPVVLDVGCGEGRVAEEIITWGGEYYGIDVKPLWKESPNPKIHFVVGRAEQVPFTRAFDVILFLYSWHFIKDFDKACCETHRLITLQGTILVIEPHEETTMWKDNFLNKNHPDYNEYEHKRNLKLITLAEKDLQRLYTVIHKQRYPQFTAWILKIKEKKER